MENNENHKLLAKLVFYFVVSAIVLLALKMFGLIATVFATLILINFTDFAKFSKNAIKAIQKKLETRHD